MAVCACRCGTLDEQLSTGEVPVHSFDREREAYAGRGCRQVEIELLPSRLQVFYSAASNFALVISAQNLFGPFMPALRGHTSCRRIGMHVIDTGGSCVSYLQLPVHRVA